MYDNVDKKGVPQLQFKLVKRKMGKDKPELIEGVGLWSFVDTVAADLMMLSRAESTLSWKQYALTMQRGACCLWSGEKLWEWMWRMMG